MTSTHAKSLRAAKLDTERLHLRPFKISDAAKVADLAGDYAVAQMCGRVPSPYLVIAAEGWIDIQAAKRDMGDGYAFAVAQRDGPLVGSMGVARDGDLWELGYWFGQPYWGLGYATEAGRAIMAWAHDSLGAETIVAGHFTDNNSSGRVLEKLGFKAIGVKQGFSLARGESAPAMRYVWPATNTSVTLEDMAH
ncbi:MAG: GNAT family N-acetyltransferase [Pseudomonadota bacterium]